MRFSLATLLAFGLLATHFAAAQGFRTEPVEHMAFLGGPVDQFLKWASTHEATFASDLDASSRIDRMADELGARISIATPIGFDSSLVAAFRAFHKVAADAVAAYDAARGRRDTDPGAAPAALRTGSQAIVAAIPAIQAAVGAFAARHEATSVGLVCRRVDALMELAAAGDLPAPESFLGTALVGMPFEDSLWGSIADFEGPDGYSQSVARLRHVSGQIGECTMPDGARWAVAEQERSYATGKNVLLFVTGDGVPHTGDGDPAGAHLLLAASPESLLLFVKSGAR